MDNKTNIIPAVAVRSIATGMFMMAFFTSIWGGIAFGGLKDSVFKYALIIFVLFIAAFIINATRLFKVSKYYPKLTTEADIAEGKKMGKWFGIIFGAEGVGILIGINIVVNIGHPELTIPTIALIVGLHFYPMAKIFKRTVDYYLATWTTLVAITAIVLTLNKTMSQSTMLAFTGTGLAIATTCYGTYMMMVARRLPRPLPVL